MRILLVALLLLAGPASAQLPQLGMDVTIHDPTQSGPLVNDTHAFAFDVDISCSALNPDFSVSYELLFTYNATDNLNVTAPSTATPPSAMCAQGGWVGTFDVVLDVDRRATGVTAPPAEVFVTVHMESSNVQVAPPAEDVTESVDWFIVTEAAQEAAKEPPVPQEQTTPGPALPLIVGALALAALRRRD